jgi:hypothetical protein
VKSMDLSVIYYIVVGSLLVASMFFLVVKNRMYS